MTEETEPKVNGHEERAANATARSASNPGNAEVGGEAAELRQAFDAQTARLDEVTRAYSRLQQDKDDFRRRAEREKERVLEVERGNVALGLLEAVDELDLMLQAAPQMTSCKDCLGLTHGVRMIRDGLLRKIEQNGIKRMATEGTSFNPAFHDAAELISVNDETLDGQVISEVRAGYRQGERVLRPARVTVGKFGEAATLDRIAAHPYGNN